MQLSVHKATLELGLSPPAEFRIFQYGVNKSSRGDFLFNEASAASVLKAQADKGNKLSVDYEHQALATPPVEAPAAAWFDLELRADGLYAVGVKWTQRASGQITAGEYNFFSPAFSVEYEGDMPRVSELINVALTNLPAMKQLQPLIAARVVPYASYPTKEEGDWDASAAEQRIRAWATSGDQIDYEKYAKAFTSYDAENPEALGSYKLPHHDVAGGDLVTVRAGLIAAGNAVSGARGGVDIPEAEMDGVRAHLAQHYAQFEMTPPWEQEQKSVDYEDDDEEDEDEEEMEMRTVLKALGLKEEMKESDAEVEAQKIGRFTQSIVKLTGASSHDEAVGIVGAWKRSHSEVAVLSQRVAEMEKAQEQTEREAIIERCVKAGKLAPKDEAMKTWLCSLSLASLKGFEASASGSTKQVELKQDQSAATVHSLGDREKTILRQLGVAEDKYIAHVASK